MATLILTTVGGVIGGPVGAALGGLFGNAIDRSVLGKPKGRQGPRLEELKVQTSSYGTPIPLLFGTLRVAGTVVWATDLQESRSTSGGGKGKPSTTNYSYSASFAVLLSARPIQGVGRIWADGKLLRGAAGDLKAQTGYRLYLGREDQAPDPLIAAAEGVGTAPAMRGQAYAVFESLALAEFGNRIPSLTFEVVADPGAISVGAIARVLGVRTADDGRLLDGYSAYGDSVRGVLENLAQIDGAWFAVDGDVIAMRAGPGSAVVIADTAAAAGSDRPRRLRRQDVVGRTPDRLTLTYYDPARDFQIGLQRARRAGSNSREDRIDLPAALSASAARAVAEGLLMRAGRRRERRSVSAPYDGTAPQVGARVTMLGETGQWRVARWVLERMVIRIDLERIVVAPTTVGATAGRAETAPDRIHGPTIVQAFELPPLTDVVASTPQLTIAATGGPGWRQAALFVSANGGVQWDAIGGTAAPAKIGTVDLPPRDVSGRLIDRASRIELTLAHGAMDLADADAAALDRGTNLALVGSELIQFGRAEPLGGARWRLSELWRGRRGTEWATTGHAVGERFVLLERETLITVPLAPTVLGGTVRVLASGVGDTVGPAAAEAAVEGDSIRPPTPVGLRLTKLPDGGVTLGWMRRSRTGWAWLDGIDAPMVEEAERYRVTVGDRHEVVTSPTIAISAVERAAGPLTVTVTQLGTVSESRPAIARV